jgi:hypothetical protein
MRIFSTAILLGLFLASCGANAPEQAASGDGWTYLGWHPSTYVAPGLAEIFTSIEDLESAVGGDIAREADATDLSSNTLLLINDPGSTSCGDPVYANVTSTATGLSLDSRACTDDAALGFTLFAIDTTLLPEGVDPITVESDYQPRTLDVAVTNSSE